MSKKWERRDQKRDKKNKMKVDSRSVFTIEREVGKRADQVRKDERERKADSLLKGD